MAKHHGHKAQVLRLITGEYSVIDKAKTIYDLGINNKRKSIACINQTQQETQK